MLGEAAKTHADAERYLRSYTDAIGAIGRAAAGRAPADAPQISVKLSALHPRYEELQRARCVPALITALGTLALAAKQHAIGLTVDAEEADRLELSLDIVAAVLADARLAGWDGLGLAVQAYQKRASAVLDWVAALGRRTAHRIPVRLVKGAYWDTEIKLAQVQGHADYPVFTRKAATDVSWLANARRMLAAGDAIDPAFATHNAHSLAFVLATAVGAKFEMQRLHGMGEALYDGVVGPACPVRVYAPVGTHEDLLAYLVRRLLENGANTSFVHRLVDASVPEDAIIDDPVARVRSVGLTPQSAHSVAARSVSGSPQQCGRRSGGSRRGACGACARPDLRRQRSRASAAGRRTRPRNPLPRRPPHPGRPASPTPHQQTSTPPCTACTQAGATGTRPAAPIAPQCSTAPPT